MTFYLTCVHISFSSFSVAMKCSHVRKKCNKYAPLIIEPEVLLLLLHSLSLCNNELFTIGGINRFTWGTTFADKPGTHPDCVLS